MAYPKWLKCLSTRKGVSIILRLNNILNVLEGMGNPHLLIKNVVHIAGTNGKGSTLSFLKQILHKSGYTVNTYTSPHLIEFNERITLNNHYISDKQLDDISVFCEKYANNSDLTPFEASTIIAIIAFTKYPADFCLIETGMGGRLDATNVFSEDQVILSIITNISYDHCDFLGNTIKKIAYEKGCIIKDNRPVIISQQNSEALDTLLNYAYCKNAPTYTFALDWHVLPIFIMNIEYIRFSVNGNSDEHFSMPSLRGKHQIVNAGNAIMASKAIQKIYGYDNISHTYIDEGIRTTYWMGRLEKIESNMIKNILYNEYELFFDGAHNESGAQVISDWVGDNKIYFIVGLTRGKDIKKFLSILHRKAIHIFAICVQSEFNAYLTNEIVEIANSMNIFNIEEIISIEDAIVKIQSMHDLLENNLVSDNAILKRILICGSLFLYQDLKEMENSFNNISK